MIVLPVANLPEAEPLPASLLEDGGQGWQHGLRAFDDDDGAGCRVSAGTWHSGIFRTRPFTFAAHEWMKVLEGSVTIEMASGSFSIGSGEAGVVPAGICCTWTQRTPVTKAFLRWDGPLSDRHMSPWHSAQLDSEFRYAGPEGSLIASANSAIWASLLRTITLSVQLRRVCFSEVATQRAG